MRVLRTILGMLLLTAGLPSLLVGAALWAAMQHRDAGGAFTGEMQRVATSGYAVVVDDVDGLLRNDAPFVRLGDTNLRLTASSGGAPVFLGIAPTADVQRYLADLPTITVTSIDLGTGALPVTSKLRPGTMAPQQLPGKQPFWLKAGIGDLDWNPTDLRDTSYSLVIMNPAAQPGVRLDSTAGIRPPWLNQTTWALLIVGSLLVMLGMIILGWPARRREVVYVVEPSQVPDLMQAIGAPLPLSRTGGGRHAGTHRPRTLADSQPRSRPPALTWPPASTPPSAPPAPPAGRGALPTPATASAVAVAPPLVTQSTPAPEAAAPAPLPAPAPGEPLHLIATPVPVAPASMTPAVTTPSAAAPASEQPVSAKAPDRQSRRRSASRPTDLPIFEASAVGAWVAETAAARTRETEARAAAARAAAAQAKSPQPAAASTEAAAVPSGYDVVVVGLEVPAPGVPATALPSVKPPPAQAAPAEGVADQAPAVVADQAAGTAAASAPATGAEAPQDLESVAQKAAGEAAESGAAGVAGEATSGEVPGPVPPAKPSRPASTPPRNALFSGAGTTGWAATGLTRADSARVGLTGKPADPSAPRAHENPPAREATKTPSSPAKPTPAAAEPSARTAPATQARPSSRTAPATQGPPSGRSVPAAEAAPEGKTGGTAAPSKPAPPKPAPPKPAPPKPAPPKPAPPRPIPSPVRPAVPVPAPSRPADPDREPVLAAQASAVVEKAPGDRVSASPSAPDGPPTGHAASTVATKPEGKIASADQATPTSTPVPSGEAPVAGGVLESGEAPVAGTAVAPDEAAVAGTAVAPDDEVAVVGKAESTDEASVAGQAASAGEAVSGGKVSARTSSSGTTAPSARAPESPSPARAAEPHHRREAGTGRPVWPAAPAASSTRPASVGPASSTDAGHSAEGATAPARPAEAVRTGPGSVNQPQAAPATGSTKVAEETRRRDSAPAADPHIAEQRQATSTQTEPDARSAAAARVDEAGATKGRAEQGRAGVVGQVAARSAQGSVRSGPSPEAVAEAGAESAGSAGGAAKPAKRKESAASRLASYKDEVAELLGGGAAARRKRKNTTASGLPALDPEAQEPPIKLTRPARKGLSRPPSDKD